MIYLDHNATTPLAPEALEAMTPYMLEHFGNPSSIHSAGRKARVALDEAREQVAALIHARPGEIVFTAGGTESDNLAIKGAAWALRDKGRHIIASQAEHPAVLNACRDLQKQDFKIDFLPVDGDCRVDPQSLIDAITEDTVLISIHHANNEVGTVQDVHALGAIARERGILFHTDAVQSVGKMPIAVDDFPVDLLSFSAHKLNGPKGAGALFIRSGVPPLASLVSGGGQEKKRRGGTENVAGIVGFGKAAELAGAFLDSDGPAHLKSLRNRLLTGLETSGLEFKIFGASSLSLPNTLGIGFDGVSGETLMIALDLEGICVSTGSACSSGALSSSHVLKAMGVPDAWIDRSLRISVGKFNTLEEMDKATEALTRLAIRIKSGSGKPAQAPTVEDAGT